MKGFELVKREDHWALYNEDGHKIAATIPGCNSKLSLKNCEAIENGYDLDELAREACNITDPLRLDSQKYKQDPYFKIGFIKGFKKALELVEHRLSKETEWQVEIITEPMTLDEIREQGKGFLNSNTRKPLLDADGCLILKRIV